MVSTTTFDPIQGFQSRDPNIIVIGNKVVSGGGSSSGRRRQQEAANNAAQEAAAREAAERAAAEKAAQELARQQEQQRLEQQRAEQEAEQRRLAEEQARRDLIGKSGTASSNFFESIVPLSTEKKSEKNDFDVARFGSDFLLGRPKISGDSLKGKGVGGIVKRVAFDPSGYLAIGLGKSKDFLKSDNPYLLAGDVIVPSARGRKVAAEFLPETRAGVITTIGVPVAITKLPTAGRIAAGVVISGLEGRRALDKDLPTEQRVASGIIGGLAATGVVFEGLPFVRGGVARLSPEFAPVKTQPEGFSGIELGKNDVIGIIPPKSPAKTGVSSDVDLPMQSPLKRGGFGVKPSEKPLYIGKGQDLGTSQIGFFKKGKEIVLEREFFTTPQDPFVNIPVTRESRLGLSGFLEFPKNPDIAFGVPKKPQVGVLRKGNVGFRETPEQFVLGKGSELEAIKSSGTITGTKKVGVTSVKGQGVDIYEFKLNEGGSIKTSIPRGKVSSGSSGTRSRISGESILGSLRTMPRTSSILSPVIPLTISTSLGTKDIISPLPTRPTRPYSPSSPARPPSKPTSPSISPFSSPIVSSVPTSSTISPPTMSNIIPNFKRQEMPNLNLGIPTFPRKPARPKRKLKRTPSFAGVELPASFNIEVPQLSEGLEMTGLFERPIKKRRKKRR